MRGSVYKRGETWSVTYDIPRDANGKRRQKTKGGFRIKREAHNYLAKKQNEISNRNYIDETNMTTGEYLMKWLSEYVEQNLKETTISGYETNLRKHIIPEIGRIKLIELKPIHVNNLYNSKLKEGLSPTTVVYIHRVLSKALKHALKLELVYRNVCELVEPPKKKKYKAHPLKGDEVKILLESAEKSKIYIPVLLAVGLGLRRGETIGLRWQDVDFKRKTISINQSITRAKNETVITTPKTESSKRVLKASDNILKIFKQEKEKQKKFRDFMEDAYQDNDLIFCYEDGSIFSINAVNHLFTKLLITAGLPHIRFHDLRHTYATLLLNRGIHMKVAQSILGHSSIKTTMDIYSHSNENMQKEAVKEINSIIF